ncbi:hypothetical protein Bca101_026575 [Brassica carinata]
MYMNSLIRYGEPTWHKLSLVLQNTVARSKEAFFISRLAGRPEKAYKVCWAGLGRGVKDRRSQRNAMQRSARDGDCSEVYNHAQHVICVVHLWRNVMAKYKSSRLENLMSAAARAFTITEFNKKFIEIQKISATGENIDLSTAMAVRDIADLEYQVHDPTGECFTVLLGPGTCTCGEYQQIGIPCIHALACSTRVGFPSNALVAPAYHVPTWRQGFIGKIYPVPSIGGLELGSGTRAPLLPPAVRRPSGVRRKSASYPVGSTRKEEARQIGNANVVAVQDTTKHPAATQYDKL